MIGRQTVFVAEFTDQGIDQFLLFKVDLDNIETGNMKFRNRVRSTPDTADFQLHFSSAQDLLGQDQSGVVDRLFFDFPLTDQPYPGA